MELIKLYRQKVKVDRIIQIYTIKYDMIILINPIIFDSIVNKNFWRE